MSYHVGAQQQKGMQSSNNNSKQDTRTTLKEQNHLEPDKATLQHTILDPMAAQPYNLLGLQKILGNQAVSGMIQAKLTVGASADSYEQEADRIAEQVTNSSGFNHRGEIPSIKPIVQRSTRVSESSPGMDKDMAFEAGAAMEKQLQTSKGAGQPLPDSTREFMESKFDTDLSQVRIHTDHKSAHMSRELNAEAFTHGRDIYIAEGNYEPNSPKGQRLLAHELTHVVQQGGTSASQSAPRQVQRLFGRKKKKEQSGAPSPTQDPQAYMEHLRSHPEMMSEKERQLLGVQAPASPPTSSFAGVPSVSQDPQRYSDYLRSHPGLLSEKERQLLGVHEQHFDFSEAQMEGFAEKRKTEQAEELAALGTGRGQDEHPHTRNEAGDLVSMTEDPRFQARYQIDRESDHGNWFARKFKRGKEVVSNKLKHAKSYLPGQHSVVPGEDYDQQRETKSQKAKRIAKTATGQGAKMIARQIPFLGSGMTIAGAVKEGKRQKVAEQVAETASSQRPHDSMPTPFLQSMATGLATGHFENKVTKGAQGAIGVVGDLSKVATMGMSQLGSQALQTTVSESVKPMVNAALKGAKGGVKVGKMVSDALMHDREYRLQAAGPGPDRQKGRVLGDLSSEDPGFAQAMLKHLTPGQMSLGQELYTNTRIQQPEGDHLLRPSQVAKLGRQEKARLRERKRMGASQEGSRNLLGQLLESEELSWYD